jgi:hypothetical protein
VRGHLTCLYNQVLLNGLLIAVYCTVHRAKIRCFEPKWPPMSIHSLPHSLIPQPQHRLVEIEKFLLHRFRSAIMPWWWVACSENDVAASNPDVLDSVEACIFSFEPKPGWASERHLRPGITSVESASEYSTLRISRGGCFIEICPSSSSQAVAPSIVLRRQSRSASSLWNRASRFLASSEQSSP